MKAGSIRLAPWLFMAVLAFGSIAAGGSDSLESAALTAGACTIDDHSEHAYSLPIATLSNEQAEAFAKGKEHFNEIWVVAPEPGVWGLGPTFNEDRCSLAILTTAAPKPRNTASRRRKVCSCD